MPKPQNPNTPSCAKMWQFINEVRQYSPELSDALADEFTNFECGWKEHVDEFHPTDVTPEDRANAGGPFPLPDAGH